MKNSEGDLSAKPMCFQEAELKKSKAKNLTTSMKSLGHMAQLIEPKPALVGHKPKMKSRLAPEPDDSQSAGHEKLQIKQFFSK